jgi:hypothetical protein
MKRVMKNYSTMAIALIVALTLNSVTVLANDEVKNTNKNIPGVEFRYIGTKENQPVFMLNLVNTVDEEFTISFRDKNGNVLYSDRLKGANISKRFVLNTDEIGTSELSVEIRSKKTNQVQLYKIGTTQSVVTETVVNKIK